VHHQKKVGKKEKPTCIVSNGRSPNRRLAQMSFSRKGPILQYHFWVAPKASGQQANYNLNHLNQAYNTSFLDRELWRGQFSVLISNLRSTYVLRITRSRKEKKRGFYHLRCLDVLMRTYGVEPGGKWDRAYSGRKIRFSETSFPSRINLTERRSHEEVKH